MYFIQVSFVSGDHRLNYDFSTPPFSGESSLISPIRFMIYIVPASLLFLFCAYVEFHESKAQGGAIQPSLLKQLVPFIGFGTVALMFQLRRVLLIFGENNIINDDKIIEKFFFHTHMSLIAGIYLFLSLKSKIYIFFVFYTLFICLVCFLASKRFMGWLDGGEVLSVFEEFLLFISSISLVFIFIFGLKIFLLRA